MFDGHVVTVNGRGVGGWRRTINAREVRVDMPLVTRPSSAARDAITHAARHYAAWLDRTLHLDIEVV